MNLRQRRAKMSRLRRAHNEALKNAPVKGRPPSFKTVRLKYIADNLPTLAAQFANKEITSVNFMLRDQRYRFTIQKAPLKKHKSESEYKKIYVPATKDVYTCFTCGGPASVGICLIRCCEIVNPPTDEQIPLPNSQPR